MITFLLAVYAIFATIQWLRYRYWWSVANYNFWQMKGSFDSYVRLSKQLKGTTVDDTSR